MRCWHRAAVISRALHKRRCAREANEAARRVLRGRCWSLGAGCGVRHWAQEHSATGPRPSSADGLQDSITAELHHPVVLRTRE